MEDGKRDDAHPLKNQTPLTNSTRKVSGILGRESVKSRRDSRQKDQVVKFLVKLLSTRESPLYSEAELIKHHEDGLGGDTHRNVVGGMKSKTREDRKFILPAKRSWELK